MPTAETILKNHELRLTDSRLAVLNVFAENNFALAHADIEERLKKNFDRVTIYRTLTNFLEKGIIHKVPDDEGAAKYALCAETCETHVHKDEHIHFKCTTCGHTECIDSIPIPDIKLPKGYKFINSNFLVEGTCRNCQNQSN